CLIPLPRPPSAPLFPYTTLFRSRGTDGADLLARRVLALLAGHGLEECRRIKERLVVAGRIVGGGLHRLLVITVDADPMHFASAQDRKSTRLNSSHLVISYAVFCL